jgi:hypothetical protein
VDEDESFVPEDELDDERTADKDIATFDDDDDDADGDNEENVDDVGED